MRFLSLRNIWMLFLYMLFCAYIITLSYVDPDGYLTSDSAHYLQMAKNLLASNGMQTTNLIPGIDTYFATWPIGYPALIAAVSFVSGLNVFWASKVVNIICLGVCFILIKRLFKERAAVAVMVFFVTTFTIDFVYTWSEVPFFTGLIWLVYSTVKFIRTNKSRYAIHMSSAAVFLFLMRYIGLIGAGIVGLIGFYYLFTKQWRKTLQCWIAGTIPLLIAGLYLFQNYFQTGLLTGMERIPRAESPTEFVQMLWDGLVAEFNLLSTSKEAFLTGSIIIFFIGAVVFLRPSGIKALLKLGRRSFLLPGMFLFVGTVYFIAIVLMRWNAHFDPFNFRLLGPFTLMAFLFLVSWTAQLAKTEWKQWRNLFYFVLGAALVINIGYKTYTAVLSPSADYTETVAQVEKRYEEIPSKSIVAFESIHARYLRPDLQYVKVHFRPYFAEKESVKQFIERVTPNKAKGVYLEHHPIRTDRYHASFVELMEKANDEREFIQLKK